MHSAFRYDVSVSMISTLSHNTSRVSCLFVNSPVPLQFSFIVSRALCVCLTVFVVVVVFLCQREGKDVGHSDQTTGEQEKEAV